MHLVCQWFERGVKEAIFEKLEQPLLNRGGGLRPHLSTIYICVLKPRQTQLHHNTHQLQRG